MSGSEMVGILMMEWAMRQTVYLPDVPEPEPGEDMAEKVAPKVGFWQILRGWAWADKRAIAQARAQTDSAKCQAN